MTFTAPAVPYFYYIADQTPIVSAHVWSKIATLCRAKGFATGRILDIEASRKCPAEVLLSGRVRKVSSFNPDREEKQGPLLGEPSAGRVSRLSAPLLYGTPYLY